MINERNASYIYIQNVACGISDDAAFTGMAAGSAAIIKSTNVTEAGTALAATDNYRIVQKKADGNYIFSPYFNSSTVTNAKKTAYAAATQQVSYWGYDGTSNTTGLGTIVTGNTYTLHFVLNHTRNTYNNAPQIKTVPAKALSTSESDLAKTLQEQFIRTFSLDREPARTILCERTANGTYTNATGWTFQYGSNIVTKTGHGLTPAAGTALRLATADPSAVATAPVYKVVSYATNTITIDVPYQGSDSAAGHLSYATVAPTAYGLKFTGLAQSFDPIVDSLTNQNVYFDIVSEDFGALTEYKATKMSRGNGTYNQVSYQEIYSQFLDKDTITSKRPRTKYRHEAVSGYTYVIYTFNILASDINWTGTGLNNKSYATITVAVKSDLATDIGYWDTVLGVS